MVVSNRIRVSEMSDREYAAFKRQRAAKAKLQQFIFRITVLVIAIITFSLIFKAFSSKAESTEDAGKCKFYKTVSLEYGETLADVAEKYFDPDYYNSINSYLSEIMEINHVKAGDELSGGKNLYIPYYSEIH